jgi:NAD(P)-dependent dehydrogenase (short-subunit alcohol dehydrogenase family)
VIEPAAGPLEGQVALVTGAGQGVGRHVALELGAQGVAVALAALSVEDLDEVAAEVEASGGQALVVPSDVTDPGSVQSMVGRVEGSLGPVDLLVTAAERPGPAFEFLNGDPDQWWRVVEGALRGPALCAYYVLKRMVPRRRGRIVNVLGDWSLGPAPVLSELACSEAAVLRLTDSLALASWSYGVSIFAVSAGRAAIEAGPDPEEETVTRVPAGLQEAGRLVSELATGSADRLTGRFFRVGDDLQELVRRSDQVEAEDCLQLRLLQLQPALEETPAVRAVPAAPAVWEISRTPESPAESVAFGKEREPAESPGAEDSGEAVEPPGSGVQPAPDGSPPTNLPPAGGRTTPSTEHVLPPPGDGRLGGAHPEAAESAASGEAAQQHVEQAAESPKAAEAHEPEAEPEPAVSPAPEESNGSEEPQAGAQPKEAASKGAADRDSHEAAPPDRVEP